MIHTRCEYVQPDVCLLIAQADIENGKIKLNYVYNASQRHLYWRMAVWNRSFGAETRVRLPPVTQNLKALDRLVRTIGELCTRRLDRISRLNVQRQGDRGLGLHSAVMGKYIDVSVLSFVRLNRS
jgi:hypothetical protein